MYLTVFQPVNENTRNMVNLRLKVWEQVKKKVSAVNKLGN